MAKEVVVEANNITVALIEEPETEKTESIKDSKPNETSAEAASAAAGTDGGVGMPVGGTDVPTVDLPSEGHPDEEEWWTCQACPLIQMNMGSPCEATFKDFIRCDMPCKEEERDKCQPYLNKFMECSKEHSEEMMAHYTTFYKNNYPEQYAELQAEKEEVDNNSENIKQADAESNLDPNTELPTTSATDNDEISLVTTEAASASDDT